MKNKQQQPDVEWYYQTFELPGRTVTLAEVAVVAPRGRLRLYRGVSIRNPKDCPISSDGIKFALTRALAAAKISKSRRAKVWADFLKRFPVGR